MCFDFCILKPCWHVNFQLENIKSILPILQGHSDVSGQECWLEYQVSFYWPDTSMSLYQMQELYYFWHFEHLVVSDRKRSCSYP